MYDVNAIHDNLSTSKLITYAGFFRSENNFAILGKILISYLIFLFVFFFRSFYDNVKENSVSFIYKFASIQTLCCGLGGSL